MRKRSRHVLDWENGRPRIRAAKAISTRSHHSKVKGYAPIKEIPQYVLALTTYPDGGIATDRQERAFDWALENGVGAGDVQLAAPHCTSKQALNIIPGEMVFSMTNRFRGSAGDISEGKMQVFTNFAGMLQSDLEDVSFMGVAIAEVLQSEGAVHPLSVINQGVYSVVNTGSVDIRSGDIVSWGPPRTTYNGKQSAIGIRGESDDHFPATLYPERLITGGTGSMYTDIYNAFIGADSFRTRTSDDDYNQMGRSYMARIQAVLDEGMTTGTTKIVLNAHGTAVKPNAVDSANYILKLAELSLYGNDTITKIYLACTRSLTARFGTDATFGGDGTTRNEAIQSMALDQTSKLLVVRLLSDLDSFKKRRRVGVALSGARPGKSFSLSVGASGK